MNFFEKLLVIIVTASLSLIIPNTTLSKDVDEIFNIAKFITVKIIQNDNTNSSSGVIFKREKNIYSVLTNQHIVNFGKKYQIFTIHDNQKHKVIFQQEIPGLDLIIFQFESLNSYQIAKFGNSDEISPLQEIYVAGYRGGKTDLDLTKGDIININTEVLKNPESNQGYALEYDNLTLPGTSGGGIFNEQGDVIGINGQAERDLQSGRDISRGIPINLFLAARDLISSPSKIEMNRILLSSNNSISEKTRFSCMEINGLPTTVATTSTQFVSLIYWSSKNYFDDSEYTATKRCMVVSQRWQNTFQNETLNHLFIGEIAGYAAICTANEKQDLKCNNENLLFILRPSDDANDILQNLLNTTGTGQTPRL